MILGAEHPQNLNNTNQKEFGGALALKSLNVNIIEITA
jgi:hypothetical protein